MELCDYKQVVRVCFEFQISFFLLVSFGLCAPFTIREGAKTKRKERFEFDPYEPAGAMGMPDP